MVGLRSIWRCSLFIHRALENLGVSLLVLLVGIPATAAGSDEPHWIWASRNAEGLANRTAPSVIVLQKSFNCQDSLRGARLKIAADFCQAVVRLNGQKVLTVEPFSPLVEIDVGEAMQSGENVVRIEAKAIEGPAAVACSLQIFTGIEMKSGSVNSDTTWRIVAADPVDDPSTARQVTAKSLGPVDRAVWGLGRRGVELAASENYGQWKLAENGQTLTSGQFIAPADFTVTLVRAAEPEEGSWISLTQDPQGRLIVSQEEKGLLRLTLDSLGDSVVQVESINATLKECRGLQFIGDDLYANANSSKGLFRLSSTDQGQSFERIDLVREFSGGDGHGRNDLARDSKGWIYSIHGDAVDVPQQNVIDRTSPFSDSNCVGSDRKGVLLKTDPQGNRWELLCGGLRNPYGVAVNEDGECFTYDADAEFDMGSPWYRPTRIVHLVPGADYGWRAVTKSWPPYYADHADNALPLLDIGKGSPTAALFGNATSFPDEYRNALFVLDWTYGRILAIHLQPRGASYRATAETFLQGRPLNVTDLIVDSEGDLLVLTGGRQTQSAIYRVSFRGELPETRPLTEHQQRVTSHAQSARAMRRQLESLTDSADPDLNLAWEQLDSPDPFLRYAARTAIERFDISAWSQKALDDTRPWARLESLLAVARSGQAEYSGSIVDRLLGLDVQQLTLMETWAVVRCYAIVRQLSPAVVDAHHAAIVAQVQELFVALNQAPVICRGTTSEQVLRDAALLLAQIDASSAAVRIEDWLDPAASQQDQLQALFALRLAVGGLNEAMQRSYFHALKRSSEFIGGEGMPGFLAKIREEAIQGLDENQLAQLADVLDPTQEANWEPLPPPRPFVQEWTVDTLVHNLDQSHPAGDAERGAAIFHAALCDRCHRSGARGPAVGPDLTHVRNRFSRLDLIRSMVDPSASVAEDYRNVQITTLDGQVITGRVLVQGDFRAEQLSLATDPLDPSATTDIDKQEIESLRSSPVSPMPAGLLDTFTASEIADLLEYLTHGSP